LLLNIEIADYFSPPGSTLTFQFQRQLARDMTYSIAWGLLRSCCSSLHPPESPGFTL